MEATKKDIMKVYNRLRVEANINSHVTMERLNKALGIALRKEGNSRYLPDFISCLCPDDRHRGTLFICKHRLAWMLVHPKETLLFLFEHPGELK